MARSLEGQTSVIQSTHVASLLEDYILYRSLRENSAYQLDRSLRAFEQWLGRRSRPHDLEDRTVSQWLRDLMGTHAQRTVANHRTNLLCLWRFAAEAELCEPPGRVRKVKRPEPCPIAWTMAELRRIMLRIGELKGRFPNGADRAMYCSTLVKFTYESGLRRSDVWTIRRGQIRADGTIVLRQVKTQRVHWPRVREDTVRAIGALPGNPPLACPFGSTGSWYQFWRREVIEPAGVRAGCLQQIRRTGATHLAIEHPEAVQRYLGHRTASMQRHYVDESIARPQQYLPPPI